MLQVLEGATAVLRTVLDGERPGPDTMAGHVLRTGHGRVWVDRMPDPRAIVVAAEHDNVLVRGEPGAAYDSGLVELMQGWVDAPAEFAPMLRSATDRFTDLNRMIMALRSPVGAHPVPEGGEVRRLRPADGDAVGAMEESVRWIFGSWGGPHGLASSGLAWGAWHGGRLVSVACTFFDGSRHEDIGVVTETDHRRRGFVSAAAAALCTDIQQRARTPSWTTWGANEGSLRTAARLGFTKERETRVYLVGVDPPD